MDLNYLIVYVTTPTVEAGQKIAQLLVSEKLAACVNILPGITSIYTWETEICEEEEFLLMIKTRADLFEALSAAIAREHPYDVPEIIAVTLAAGAASYLHWIDKVTREV